jgi:hypothetical protein
MADYLGPNQNRVLDVKDRNLDNVVFLYKHPPLTSEWNLINQIGNEKIQSLAKVSMPSGWLHVDDILQDADEATARTGSVVCSSDYPTTSFKLFSWDSNYAIVNGWPILVQGYGPQSVLTDNVIQLDAASNENNNFVFLEVWRKLVGTSDTIYRYGNVDRPLTDNEIEWDVVGCETTQRVQIQYRIRSVLVSSLSDGTKEVFDNNVILPMGGRSTPSVLGTGFKCAGPSDPGLYIAGDGSDEQKDYLGTVDGYVYAIPMFVAYRRPLSVSKFISTSINSTKITKEMSIEGYRSDRPDNKLADVVYKDDIVDVRHRVMTSDSIKNTVETTIGKLLAGDLTTAYKKYTGDYVRAYSGGNTLLKVERLNSVSGDGIPNVGTGSSILGTIFKRRAFCNADVTLGQNIVEISFNGSSSWESGTFSLASKVTLPAGAADSADYGFYSPTYGTVTGITFDGDDITIETDSSLVVDHPDADLFMVFKFTYDSSSSGFSDIPKEFIEVNKNDAVAIATRDNDVLLKFNSAGEVINFAETSPSGYGYPDNSLNVLDKVHYAGGNYTSNADFGHELVLTRTAVNGIVNIPLVSYKYNQYYVLGVKAVEVSSVLTNVDEVELTSDSCILTINTLLSTASATVTVRLYTGSAVLSYTEAASFKFFELSKQGKGIIDTYEMIMVTAPLVGGKFIVDTGNKPIIKIATTLSLVDGFPSGRPYVFNTLGERIYVDDPTVNTRLPVLSSTDYADDWLPTRIELEVTGPTDPIMVPVLVHSFVASTEAPYNFYYKTVPYQGLLNTTDSSPYGKVVGEESALISSSGSGSINNYVYSEETVDLISDRIVTGNGTKWESYVVPGDYFRIAGSSYEYEILSVDSDTELTLSENYMGTPDTEVLYEIVRKDVPASIVSNIVGRLPALSAVSSTDITDYTCYSDNLEASVEDSDAILTSAKRKLQDPLNALTNDFKLGEEFAKRGRYNFQMTESGNPIFKVGSGRPYLIYQETSSMPAGHNKKVYQFYLFMMSGKDYQVDPILDYSLMGKLYLMIVAGETVGSTKNYLNPFLNRDVVDIFELVGRPIIRG